eukprot:5631233-Prorocentrum_lima.AAC.1
MIECPPGGISSESGCESLAGPGWEASPIRSPRGQGTSDAEGRLASGKYSATHPRSHPPWHRRVPQAPSAPIMPEVRHGEVKALPRGNPNPSGLAGAAGAK